MDTTVVHGSTKTVEKDVVVSVIDKEEGVTIREVVDDEDDTIITIDSDEGVENAIEALENAVEEDDEVEFSVGDVIRWGCDMIEVIGRDDDIVHLELTNEDSNGQHYTFTESYLNGAYENGDLEFVDEPIFRIGDEVKWYNPLNGKWKQYTVSGVDGEKINFDRENGLDVWCYYDQAKSEYGNGNIEFIDNEGDTSTQLPEELDKPQGSSIQ